MSKFDANIDVAEEYKDVILNLIRHLDSVGGIKINDQVTFACSLIKEENGYWNIMDANVRIDPSKE
jgi:hypothetical protein